MHAAGNYCTLRAREKSLLEFSNTACVSVAKRRGVRACTQLEINAH